MKMQDADYQDFNFRSLSYDVGCSIEEEPFRGETGAVGDPICTLDGIELDTPPEMMSTPPLLDTPLEVSAVPRYFGGGYLSSRSIDKNLNLCFPGVVLDAVSCCDISGSERLVQ